MDEKFEIEVLTRLAVIESKIDDYNNIKEKSEKAYNIAKRNEEVIQKIEDRNKWLWRTALSALITGLVGILIFFIKIGIGVG
ncbi:MAG: hemolysin XhlA family protein [Bacilli bacterium]|nr:hemolysin XhlA family protein [Bacilli bacterium]MBP3635397.1 hemolysin XhlA family protein [Bacilli bacterium]